MDQLISKTEKMHISGSGEIILHPDFKELVSRITAQGKGIIFSSNGSLLSKDIVDLLAESSMHMLNISVNSLNPDTYRFLSGGGELSVVLNNISHLLSTHPKYEVQYSFVMTQHNFQEIKNFIDFGNSRRIGSDPWPIIVLYDLHDICASTYPDGLAVPDTPDNRAQLEELKDYARTMHVYLSAFDFDLRKAKSKAKKIKIQERMKHCPIIAGKMLFVEENGNLPQCDCSPHKLGNLFHQTVEEVLTSDEFLALQQCAVSGDDKYCSDCKWA
jgi:radical SAM protein with 4Fe4S-binding SPASM domain